MHHLITTKSSEECINDLHDVIQTHSYVKFEMPSTMTMYMKSDMTPEKCTLCILMASHHDSLIYSETG